MTVPYPPVYHCIRTTETVTVDGRLDEKCWRSSPAVRLTGASNGNAAGPVTLVRARWDASHLYVAFECEDEDIWGTLANRDDPLYDEEVVEVFLSPTGNLARYLEIEVSPRNVVFDAALHSPQLDRRTMTTDREWTCEGMQTAVASDAPVHTTPPAARSATGPPGQWTVEIAIPFASLPGAVAPEPGTEWRVNFYRIDRNKRSRYLAWSPTLRRPADFHVPERFGVLRFEDENAAVRLQGQWSASRANQWNARLPWLVGCNFIPSTAINQLEMWQAETFDAQTIDRELGWAAGLGMNTARVYLHDIAWQVDPKGFRERVRRYLAIASRHAIRTVFVLFDDCWNPTPRPGPQPTPIPGVHNSGWLQSPGADAVNNPSEWGRLEAYVKDVVGCFGQDRRILMWDLYNEPGNSDQGARSLPLLSKTFEWARSASPLQPLTAGIWFDHADLNSFQIRHSDVITFHNYQGADQLRAQIQYLRRHGRPILCTEWMARPASAIASHLPIFHENGVACIMWGLVAGKTQTIYPWRSPEGSPEPEKWFHDVLRPDGTPYDEHEAALLRALTQARRR